MISNQIDMPETALVDSIRGNLCEFFRFLARSLPPDEGLENEHFVRWYTPLPHPWFNGILCSSPPAQADGDFIWEAIQYFKEREVGVFTCWLEPPLKRSDWDSVLSEYGFGFSDDTPGMAVNLQTLPQTASMPKGLEIRIIEDEEEMRAWAHVFTLGYGMPPDWEDMIFEVWFKLGLDFPVQNYLGYLDGEAVSTSTVFYGAGVAGIYDVATLPETRGHGIGSAMTLAPLLDARRADYRIGVLQSSEMGYGVYQKMGFRHLCQIENYYFKG